MKATVTRPVFDKDEYYESSSRTIRWICLALVLITYPFTGTNGLVVLTLLILTAVYNALRHSSHLLRQPWFGSRLNALAVDHLFVLTLVVLSGGLTSPYYPFFYLLILAVIASYGIAGFAFSLSAQLFITLVLLNIQLDPLALSPESQFVIKLATLIIFCLLAEQSVRSHNEEYLLESRFTRQIQNERQRLLALINSLSHAVLAVDEQGNVYLYNAAALDLLNTNRDITGLPINDLLPLRDSQGKHINLLRLIKADDRTLNRQDLIYEASDGSRMDLDLTLSPVRVFGFQSDTWGGYMAVFRDITKQKSLDQERDEFISVTSHELRTPLAIAEANLSTALLPNFATIDPKARDLVNQAHDNIIFLSDLIQDLSTLARAERGDLEIKRQLIDVRMLVDQLARDHKAGAQAKGLTFQLKTDDVLGHVVSSEPELREILQNFLTNAIKYTVTGSITLQVTRSATGTDFAVADTGIGISASDKTKIFGKFYRSEDYRTRQTGGTGLGLYITKKLAQKLGADISFTSKLNHGSTFRIHLPNRLDPTEIEAVANTSQTNTSPQSK